MALSLRAAAAIDPEALFVETIAPVATAATKTAVDRAPSPADAGALILASAEFQRR
jgi:uncharacterized protein (DUF1800 family)